MPDSSADDTPRRIAVPALNANDAPGRIYVRRRKAH